MPSSLRIDPAAHPSLVTKRGFIVEVTGPRMPSVPNFLSLLKVERTDDLSLIDASLLIESRF